MQSMYEQTHRILTRDCDITGAWRPDAIFTATQETSGMHTYLLGCDHFGILPESLLWVLYRVQLTLHRDSRIGEKVTIRTYHTKNLRMFFPRHFLIYGEDGELRASSSTLWLLMDKETRRMTDSPIINQRTLETLGNHPALDRPETVFMLEGTAETHHRQPAYTDLDINGHVNNAHYVGWLCDALGIDCLRENRIESLLVNYRAEIRPGAEVQLRLIRKGQEFSMEAVHGDQQYFSCSGHLVPRV